MNKPILSLLFALIVGLLGACTSPQQQEEEQQSENETSSDQESMQGSVEPAPFEVKTLVDTIASPRRELTATIDGVDLTVNYGSPSVKGRVIWGELIPYGEVWRTGANEATTIELSQDANIEGQTLPAGKYGLFTIPGENDWTLIFNETADQWGAYEYDEAKDVMRVKVSPQMMGDSSETMEFGVEGDQLVLMWDKVKVPMTIQPA